LFVSFEFYDLLLHEFSIFFLLYLINCGIGQSVAVETCSSLLLEGWAEKSRCRNECSCLMNLLKGLWLRCIFLFACARFLLLIFDLVYLNSRYLRTRTVASVSDVCILFELRGIILIVFVVFLLQRSRPRHLIRLLNPAHRRVAHVSELAVHHRVLMQRRGQFWRHRLQVDDVVHLRLPW